jgi:hypothetical protein
MSRTLIRKEAMAYQKAHKSCLTIVAESKTTALAAKNLEDFKNSSSRKISDSNSLLNTGKYYLMAIDHSLEIVKSIRTRFESGGRHPDSTFIRFWEVK